MSSVRYAIQIGNVLYEGKAFFQGCAAARSDLPVEANPYIQNRETADNKNWEKGWIVQSNLLLINASLLVRGG